jgi:hypothetical protein
MDCSCTLDPVVFLFIDLFTVYLCQTCRFIVLILLRHAEPELSWREQQLEKQTATSVWRTGPVNTQIDDFDSAKLKPNQRAGKRREKFLKFNRKVLRLKQFEKNLGLSSLPVSDAYSLYQYAVHPDIHCSRSSS